MAGGLILSPDKHLDFHAIAILLLAGVLKYLKTSGSTKQFCDPSSTKYFASLRILHSFIKSFVNPFHDISLTSPD